MMMEERARQELLACLKGIRRFAYALTGSMADADDLMQATVLRVLEREMPADADMRRWSYRICRNLWIDMRRANRVRSEWSTLQSEIGETVVDGQHLADVAVSFQEVGMAMRDIPEAQRALLVLVAIEGLSYREAAEFLGIPEGTVMSRLSRARASLVARISKIPVDRSSGQGKESVHADR